MLRARLDRSILRYNEGHAVRHRAAEPVSGPVAHSVVLELLAFVFRVVKFHKPHRRVLAAHFIHQRLRSEPQQLKILCQHYRSVHRRQLRDQIRVSHDLFLPGVPRQFFQPLAVAEQISGRQPVLDVHKFLARLLIRHDQNSAPVTVIAHHPQDPVEQPQTFFTTHMRALFELL